MIEYACPRGVTRIEAVLILVFVLGGGLVLWCVLGMLAGVKSKSRRYLCQRNLEALSVTCHLYADSSINNGRFPDDGKSACGSMNLLFDTYVNDCRIWECSTTPAEKPLTQLKKSTDGANLSNQMTHYGYDRRHGPADTNAQLMGEMGPVAAPGSSSQNHMNKVTGEWKGQNVTDVNGHGYWMNETTIHLSSRLSNDDIFRDDSTSQGATPAMDSWIRNN